MVDSLMKRENMDSMEKPEMNKKRWKDLLILIILAAFIALILWLTLFSRVGSYSRHFLPPFWSYRAIISGSGKALFEDIGNIVLFIPVGVAAALVFKIDMKRCLMIGFALSLLIESCQWFFWLGSFEFDDLVHNTLGTGIGVLLVKRTPIGEKIKLGNRKKSLAALLTLVLLIISSGFIYQGLKWHEMKHLASLNDREDGVKNNLVLSPDPKYIGKTDFSVAYQSDGCIIIEGQSVNRAWIEIGRVALDPGTYCFTGLSGAEEKTIAIELEYFDAEKEKYIRLTPDVGAVEQTIFELDAYTKVRALIGIYPGSKGRYLARPAIYREDN